MKESKDVKIICWNINGIRAFVKKGCFDWFLKQNPEFFCIQETKAHPEQLTKEVLQPESYTSYFDHSKIKKGYSGVAVYVKNTMSQPEKIDSDLFLDKKETETLDGKKQIDQPDKTDDQADQEGRFLALHYKNIVLINCYFPNGGGEPHRLEYKLRFYEAFLKYVNKIKKIGKEVVFCGDLNVAHTEIDLARPKENSNHVGFLPVERKWVDKVIEAGFVDSFREKYPNKKEAYSWWDMKTMARERNVGWRIDYFFTTKKLVEEIKKVEIHSEIYGSDHCPISLVLNTDF